MDRYQTAFTVIFEEGSEPFHILDEKYVQTARDSEGFEPRIMRDGDEKIPFKLVKEISGMVERPSMKECALEHIYALLEPKVVP